MINNKFMIPQIEQSVSRYSNLQILFAGKMVFLYFSYSFECIVSDIKIIKCTKSCVSQVIRRFNSTINIIAINSNATGKIKLLQLIEIKIQNSYISMLFQLKTAERLSRFFRRDNVRALNAAALTKCRSSFDCLLSGTPLP